MRLYFRAALIAAFFVIGGVFVGPGAFATDATDATEAVPEAENVGASETEVPVEVMLPNDGVLEVIDDVWAEDIGLVIVGGALLLALALLVVGLVLGLRADKDWKNDLTFYPVSMTKFVVLSLVTFGLYAFFWVFKNWRWYRENRDGTVMPFWRVFFLIFWFYPLLNRIRMEKYNDAGFPKWQAIAAGVVFVPAWIWSSGFDRLPTSIPVILGLAVWLWLLPMMFAVSKVNGLNRERPELVRRNSRFGFLSITAVVIGGPVFLFVVASTINLVPTTNLTKGAHLWAGDRAYIERIGAVTPEEQIIYFYSAAIMSIETDGNMLTDQGIASYWQDEGQAVQVVFANFDEIDKISVETQGDFTENSTILITTLDGREIYLYLPAEAGADKLFLRTARRHIAAAGGS